jgi:hypothetical protein
MVSVSYHVRILASYLNTGRIRVDLINYLNDYFFYF